VDRKIVLIVIAIIAAAVGGCLFWRYWHGGHPDLLVRKYRNTRFGYSVEYPTSWYLGDVGEPEDEANPAWFVSSYDDVQLMEGGLPHEVTVPIVVSNVGELAAMDSSMPEIESSWDWVNWRRSQWGESDYERLGSFEEEEMTVDGKVAVRTTYEANSAETGLPAEASAKAGPWIVVILFDPNSNFVYQIEYVGRQPYYDTNLTYFEAILSSFRINN
jgi:hypothetical protein